MTYSNPKIDFFVKKNDLYHRHYNFTDSLIYKTGEKMNFRKQ